MECLISIMWYAVVGAVIIFLVHANNLRTYWQKRRVPSGFDFPYVGGTAALFFRTQSIYDIVWNLYNRFPDTRYYGTLAAHQPTIVVRDPELIREFGIKQFDSFMDHVGFVTPEMDPIFGRNVFSLKGQEWKDMRGTLSPSFSAAKMKFMFELICKCAQNFVQYFINNPKMAHCIDMKDVFTRYTNDVIATAAFGIEVNSLEDRSNEFHKQGAVATIINPSKFIAFKLFPRLMRWLGYTFMANEADRFFKKLITETVKTREEKGIVRPDMMYLLSQARDADGEKLSISDIMAQAFVFFMAGFETAANHMCAVVHELAMNPEIQERLYREIKEQVPKDGGPITYESLSQMKYMDMVLKEALRKYPPAPITDRVCTKRIQFPAAKAGFSEYLGEVGIRLTFPIYALHHDSKYFPNPKKFDPERFNDENKDSIHPGTYIPFGIGPRQCIASRFALMETKIVLTYILLNFEIKRTHKTRHPVTFTKSINVGAEGGFWNKFEPRKKSE